MATNSIEELWWQSNIVLLALFFLTAAVSLVDRRRIGVDGVWVKPLKFQISLALHFVTMAGVASMLSAAWRESLLLSASGLAAIAATAFEVGYIMFQAARQQESHFNLTTPFSRTMYALMAIGAVFITVAAGAVGMAAALDEATSMGAATRAGSAIGLVGGTVLTLIVAFRMGGALSRHVGTEALDAPRMPLTGWSLTVGDRRVPHFFATHFMQAGPIIGLAADATLPAAAAVPVTVAACLAYALATVFLFAQANRGLPITAGLTLESPFGIDRVDHHG